MSRKKSLSGQIFSHKGCRCPFHVATRLSENEVEKILGGKYRYKVCDFILNQGTFMEQEVHGFGVYTRQAADLIVQTATCWVISESNVCVGGIP